MADNLLHDDASQLETQIFCSQTLRSKVIWYSGSLNLSHFSCLYFRYIAVWMTVIWRLLQYRFFEDSVSFFMCFLFIHRLSSSIHKICPAFHYCMLLEKLSTMLELIPFRASRWWGVHGLVLKINCMLLCIMSIKMKLCAKDCR